MRTLTTPVLLTAVLLFGCSTAPSLKPIPNGEAVSISVVASERYPSVIDIRNTAISDGLSTGIGSGGVVGGLWGLTCGPFAVLCVPIGAVTGMVTGGAAGAAVGATGVLSQEKADRIKERLMRLEQTHPILVELKRNLGDRAQKYWNLNSELSTTLVTVELQELQVATTRDERLRFVLRVFVSRQETSWSREVKAQQKIYEYASP